MKTILRTLKKAFDFLSKIIINNEDIVSYVKKTQKIKIQNFLKQKMEE